jgi:murein DD-endopeptidase MepM/ murein hydrolase activator NlpD
MRVAIVGFLAVSAVTTPQGLSAPLRNSALRSPLPGGICSGYAGDTGLDIAGRYLPVYAIADGVLEYSEWGHTLWRGPDDTAYSVRIRLDHPIALGGNRQVTHVYYTHLSAVVTTQAESSPTHQHVVAGERIATSGVANHVPHLHLGLLLDNQVEQDSWDFILREDAVRRVLGGYRNGETLP